MRKILILIIIGLLFSSGCTLMVPNEPTDRQITNDTKKITENFMKAIVGEDKKFKDYLKLIETKSSGVVKEENYAIAYVQTKYEVLKTFDEKILWLIPKTHQKGEHIIRKYMLTYVKTDKGWILKEHKER